MVTVLVEKPEPGSLDDPTVCHHCGRQMKSLNGLAVHLSRTHGLRSDGKGRTQGRGVTGGSVNSTAPLDPERTLPLNAIGIEEVTAGVVHNLFPDGIPAKSYDQVLRWIHCTEALFRHARGR